MQRSSQIGKTKKQTSNERTREFFFFFIVILENSSEEEIVEMEASNSSGRGFTVMTIRILNIMKKRHRNHKKGPVRNKECNI